jgi:hypothetical protein
MHGRSALIHTDRLLAQNHPFDCFDSGQQPRLANKDMSMATPSLMWDVIGIGTMLRAFLQAI